MAAVSELITLGIGTPSSIPYLVLFGLGPNDVAPIDPDPIVITVAALDRSVGVLAVDRTIAVALNDRSILIPDVRGVS